jgi:hypothetical protein
LNIASKRYRNEETWNCGDDEIDELIKICLQIIIHN